MFYNGVSMEKYLSSSKTLTSSCLDPLDCATEDWIFEVMWQFERPYSSSWSIPEGRFHAILFTSLPRRHLHCGFPEPFIKWTTLLVLSLGKQTRRRWTSEQWCVFTLWCMKKRQILNIILKPGTEISLEETTAISELSSLDKCSPIVLQCWATYEI